MNKIIKVFVLGLVIGLFSISTLTVFGNSIVSKNNHAPATIITKAIKSKTEAIDVNLKIPVVTAKNNTSAIKKINNRFHKDALNFNNSLVNQANQALKESKKNKNIPFHTYAAYTTYKTHFNNNGLLSIAVRYSSYTGGANGLEVQTGYTSKLKNGNLLKLSDLFETGFDYKKVISNEILKQMKANKENYFPEAITKFEQIKGDHPYYIENNNLVVFYGPFEIAPHVSGIPEFKIPFSMLKFKNTLGI